MVSGTSTSTTHIWRMKRLFKGKPSFLWFNKCKVIWFVNKGKRTTCHNFPYFTNGETNAWIWNTCETSFNFLKVPMMSHKQWLDSIGWMFVDFMYKEMLQKAKQVISNAPYLILSCDKLIIVQHFMDCSAFLHCSKFCVPIHFHFVGTCN